MSPALNRILFATDLSRNCYFAFRHVVMLAKLSGAEIHNLHVVEPLSEDARVTLSIFVQDDEKRKEALANRMGPAKERLEQRQDRFWAEEVSEEDRHVRDQIVSLEIIEGHAAETILRRAEEKKCDLIVLGTHEHGFSHTFLGSTAKRVLRRAGIPTLIVPYRPEA